MNESEVMEWAKTLHQHQTRVDGSPYVIHLANVVTLIKLYVPEPSLELILAGWLHDAVEDGHTTLEEISQRTNPRVAAIVEQVTDYSIPSDGPRHVRRSIDREHLAMGDADGHNLKLCDILHNISDIIQSKPDFAKLYLEEKLLALSVLSKGDTHLWSLVQSRVRTLLSSLKSE